MQVTRPGNRGTYVLAIGEAEQWGPIEALSALMALSHYQARLLSPVRPAGLADPHRSRNGRPRRAHPAGRLAAEQAHPPTDETPPSNGKSHPHHRCPCSSQVPAPTQEQVRTRSGRVLARPPISGHTDQLLMRFASALGAAVLAAAATGSSLSHRAPTVSAMLASVPPPASARGATQASSRRPPRAL